MKKLFGLFLAVLLFIMSCKSEDDLSENINLEIFDDSHFTVIGNQLGSGAYLSPTTDNSFIIIANNGDVNFIKIGNDFDVEWMEVHGGPQTDEARAVIQTTDEGYAIVGRSNSFDNNGFDAWVLKTDLDGQAEWNYTFGTGGNDLGASIIETTDKELLFVGSLQGINNGSANTLFGKLNATGEEQWIVSRDSQFIDRGQVILETENDEFVILNSTAVSTLEVGLFLQKVTKDGQTIWIKDFPEITDLQVSDLNMALKEDGGFIISATRNLNNFDAFILNLNKDGDILWSQTIGGGKTEFADQVIQTQDKGFVFAGASSSFGDNSLGVYLVKLQSDGTIEWERYYDGSGSEQANGLYEKENGDLLIVGGKSDSPNDLSFDLIVFQTDSEGRPK